jgi:hypothetical protein
MLSAGLPLGFIILVVSIVKYDLLAGAFVLVDDFLIEIQIRATEFGHILLPRRLGLAHCDRHIIFWHWPLKVGAHRRSLVKISEVEPAGVHFPVDERHFLWLLFQISAHVECLVTRRIRVFFWQWPRSLDVGFVNYFRLAFGVVHLLLRGFLHRAVVLLTRKPVGLGALLGVGCRCIRETLVEIQHFAFAFFLNRVADEFWWYDSGLVALVGADGSQVSGVVYFEPLEFQRQVDLNAGRIGWFLGHELGLNLIEQDLLAVVEEDAKHVGVGFDEVFGPTSLAFRSFRFGRLWTG